MGDHLMGEAALRNDASFDTSIVRRLMARPLRLVETPMAEIVPLRAATPSTESVEPAEASADVARLKAQLQVMKAVLRSERDETAHLRARIATIAESDAPLTPEAQAVRDRWAALVDQLLHSAR
ncbi:hypothetical protein MKK49_06020 [Methylobacterium sp. J-090]|nr:hypothetical protein [Methylobacterium sp. J-090]